MKKFTKILICLMLCVFGFGLVACDNRTPEEKSFTYPTVNDAVYGNGGLAVKKGNYVYFVNGYQSVSGISNKEESFTLGALMLMKLGANGEVVTNENNLLKDEYYITMSDRLCGYEATNLFIFGEYLYFVSPSLENESGDEVWAKERVVFNRIKLDKTSKVEEVYSSGVKYDQLEYQYYQANGNLFILAWEKGDSYYADNGNNALIRIDASAKSSALISTGVNDVIFADNADEIFYTTNNDDYHFLKQYNILSGASTNYASMDKAFDARFVAGGKVYITTAHSHSNATDIMVSTIENKSGFELLYAYVDSAELDVTPDGSAVVMVKDKTITLIDEDGETVTLTDDSATTIKVIDYTNGCILYYDTASENTSIKLVSYYNALTGGDTSIKTLTTVTAIEEDYAYFDLSEEENYLYFYKKANTNYYLNRIKVNNNLEETEEMFGVYLEGDIPVVEEEPEVEEEE